MKNISGKALKNLNSFIPKYKYATELLSAPTGVIFGHLPLRDAEGPQKEFESFFEVRVQLELLWYQ